MPHVGGRHARLDRDTARGHGLDAHRPLAASATAPPAATTATTAAFTECFAIAAGRLVAATGAAITERLVAT
ncbi:MAG TPA: hypothetical protein VJY35_17180, partial [Candidatus Eisenbacteria bacterium]|nr:hypothetical protein [Candidatus Eisenbacteria bacterium]